MNYDHSEAPRRGSRSRALERSLSYSEAIGNNSGRSSIEIPNIVHTDVYFNEELKKQYRISQTYVEGKEIAFPSVVTNVDTKNFLQVPTIYDSQESSHYSSEDEHIDEGIIMTIDVEDAKTSDDTRHVSDASTRVMASSSTNDHIYDRIETVTEDSVIDERETIAPPGYSTPYSRRRKRSTHRRRHGRPIRSRRVVLKNGEENVPVRSNIPAKSIKYARDIVNTVINSKWRFILLMMVVAHFVFWFVFAAIWLAVASSYQDDIGDGKEHCVTGTQSFAGLLMMSVETQMTIGYGVRYPNEECPEAIIIMVFEIVAGTALSGGLSSLLFTKLIRPNRHVSSVGFSKKATVCRRDGELCLQFRVWDLMNVHLIGSTITAYMLKPIRTIEGEQVQNYIHQLELKEARAFLLWPITVVHVIDANSPLYDLSAQDMMDYRFEIVVCLTGASKNMGTTTQSRTSYLSKEIIWGYRFKNVVHYSKKDEAYKIDVENLDTVEQVDTPLCSASYLKELEEEIKTSTNILSSPNMSVSPTDMSLQEDSSTLSKFDSLPSSPTLNRNGTQRSFGWNFKRFYPERYLTKELKE
ncbi:G protein-activated inward rectifier potassium channel 3-like [Anticarsia gemmatalis]|uniref:G protein-activated inward rectifier potassium channel 3-like n=1 Tax=Anticarsia gemmatalis TaxID=129554 RepID=UPI003F75FB87